MIGSNLQTREIFSFLTSFFLDVDVGHLEPVSGDGKRSERHPVEGVGEADDILASGHFARELEGGFDRVRACRSGELHAVAHASGLEDDALERFEEVLLGFGRHVERVGHAILQQVLDEPLLQERVVVSIVQGTGTREEVDVLASFSVEQRGAARS